jgi:hypothetical protein
MIKCGCGCNAEIEPRDKYGRPHRFKPGHQTRVNLDKIFPNRELYSGKGHYNWKGGRQLGSGGYMMVKCKGHPRARASNRYRVREHVLVMEKRLGRYLKKGEVVHHINEIRTDNRIENLQLRNNREHTIHHTKLNWQRGIYTEDNQRRYRDPNTGRFTRL